MLADYPIKYLATHWPNIRAMGWAAIRNATPITRPGQLPQLPVHLKSSVAPMNNEIVDQYAAWAGAPASRYSSTLPVHFCSHWAMPMLARLGGLAPYNLLSLLNQGVRIQVHQPLERNQPFSLHGSLMDVAEEADRIRIHTRIQANQPDGQLAMVIDSYSTVPKGRPSSKGKAEKRVDPEFELVGHWTADEEDGLAFAMLTGDFNPIHTIKAVGKRTRFKSCILHGFGQLARTWEVLLNADLVINDLDVRWIKPLPLPNADMQVEVSTGVDGQGYRQLRLAAADGTPHMVGRFK
ncbi:MAG TPA: MaoC family dehydratase [Limnobacter sp.]|nr:MaoC family dehydratase [Limnobacter sp.]